MWRLRLLLGVITLIAGTTPFATGLATAEFPPLTLAFVRFGTAAVLLAITMRALGRRFALERGDVWRLLLLGAICVPINQAGFLFGVRASGGSHGGILYALTPVLTYWISRAFRREQPNARMFVATLLSFLGAGIAAMSTGAASADLGSRTLVGDLLLVTAVSSWSFFVVLSQPLVQRLGSFQTLTLVFAFGAALQLPLVLLDYIAFDLGTFEVGRVTAAAWFGLAFITVITAYTNYLLWYLVTSKFEVTRSTVVTNLSFVVTIALEAVFLGTKLTWAAPLGALVLLVGILIANRARRAAT